MKRTKSGGAERKVRPSFIMMGSAALLGVAGGLEIWRGGGLFFAAMSVFNFVLGLILWRRENEDV